MTMFCFGYLVGAICMIVAALAVHRAPVIDDFPYVDEPAGVTRASLQPWCSDPYCLREHRIDTACQHPQPFMAPAAQVTKAQLDARIAGQLTARPTL